MTWALCKVAALQFHRHSLAFLHSCHSHAKAASQVFDLQIVLYTLALDPLLPSNQTESREAWKAIWRGNSMDRPCAQQALLARALARERTYLLAYNSTSMEMLTLYSPCFPLRLFWQSPWSMQALGHAS